MVLYISEYINVVNVYEMFASFLCLQNVGTQLFVIITCGPVYILKCDRRKFNNTNSGVTTCFRHKKTQKNRCKHFINIDNG